MATRLRMRLKLLVIFGAFVLSLMPQGSAQSINFAGQDFKIVESAISKSTIARLVDVYSEKALDDPGSRGKPIYLPAGVPLAILDKSYVSNEGREWHLASTEDGILLFVAGKNRYSSKPALGFFPKAVIDQINANTDRRTIAVIVDKVEVETEKYGRITFTQSEVYSVVDPDAGDNLVSIVVGRAKLADAWTGDEVVSVSRDFATIISEDAFTDINTWAIPFRRYDVFADARKFITDALIERGKDPATHEDRIRNFLATRFIESKGCESEIKFDVNINAELGIDVSGVLSPVTAKLGITGGLTGTTQYGKGEEFDVKRFERRGISYEIKSDRTRADSNCTNAPVLKTLVSGTDSTSGEITAHEIQQAGFSSGNNGFPLYTCRDEFLKLRNILTNRYGLPRPIATFTIWRLGEFRSVGGVNVCSPPTTQVSG